MVSFLFKNSTLTTEGMMGGDISATENKKTAQEAIVSRQELMGA